MAGKSEVYWMNLALTNARRAAECGEVPVGAIITLDDGTLVAEAYNRREGLQDPLAHAEMLAIAAASRKLQRWRLTGCTLWVTLEPCPMCAGAAVNARISRVVFGAKDPRVGAAGTVFKLLQHPAMNHRPSVLSGVAAEECGEILSDFFRARRRQRAASEAP